LRFARISKDVIKKFFDIQLKTRLYGLALENPHQHSIRLPRKQK